MDAEKIKYDYLAGWLYYRIMVYGLSFSLGNTAVRKHSTRYLCSLPSQYVHGSMSSTDIYVKSTQYLCKFENSKTLTRYLK